LKRCGIFLRAVILEKLNSVQTYCLKESNQALGPDATGLGQIFWYTLEGRDQDGNVTGGWDLQNCGSIQDYVKIWFIIQEGVSEVAL
jgi:Cu(I)/Ag(I) efflux system membrane protein CusA/SilA